MAQRPEQAPADAKMDADALYREDVITDRKMGTLRRMIPVKRDGSDDTARPTLYVGEAQIMTNAGPLPINFEVEAKNLTEAVEKFGGAAKEPIFGLEMIEELRGHGYTLSPGTLYPIFHGLEKAGFLSAEGKVVNGKMRKYYRATAKGRRMLAEARGKIKELVGEVLED